MGYRTTRRQLKTLSPRNTRGINQICALQRDNISVGDFWLCLEGDVNVTIVEQKTGCPVKQQITMQRSTFNRFIDWYMREQKIDKAA
jgi:hypothetical protein